MYMIDEPLPTECIKNIEKFTKEKILKEDNTFILVASGSTENTVLIPTEEEIIIELDTDDLKNRIEKRISYILEKREISKVYIGFFEDIFVLEEIKAKNLNGVIVDGYYLYVDVDKMSNKSNVSKVLSKILSKIDTKYTSEYLESKLNKRPQRYVKIVSSVNPIWKKQLNELREEYKTEKKDKVPLLHGI